MLQRLPLRFDFPPHIQVTLGWHAMSFGASPTPMEPLAVVLTPLQATTTPAFVLFSTLIPTTLREMVGKSLLEFFCTHPQYKEMVVPIRGQRVVIPEGVPLFQTNAWISDLWVPLAASLRLYGLTKSDLVHIQQLNPTDGLPRHTPQWPHVDKTQPVLLLLLGASRHVVFHRHDVDSATPEPAAVFRLRSGDVLLLKSGVSTIYDLTVGTNLTGHSLLLHWRCVLPIL